MVNCLLCGTLNNDDFSRCSLCRTEPDLAIRVLTESRRWVTTTLIVTVFLALAGSVALDLYLADRAFFHDRSSTAANLENPSDSGDAVDANSSQATSATLNLSESRDITALLKDTFLILLWMVVSIGFVGGVLWGVRRGTFFLCTEMVRRALRKKISANEYLYPGIQTISSARFGRARSNIRGTL